jgi:hypothetical protein
MFHGGWRIGVSLLMKVIKNLELCKQNPNQRRDNLTPEEFERI